MVSVADGSVSDKGVSGESVIEPSMDLPTRFTDKFVVNPDTGCWEWVAAKVDTGYGVFWWEGGLVRAHRFSYEAVAPIPDGLVLDHLCRVRNCVNPDHLEPVTIGENVRRGIGPIHYTQRETCEHGHGWTEENTIQTATQRRCRTCDIEFKRHRRTLGLPDGDHRHGRYVGYNSYGCRCDECKEAARVYHAEQRRRRSVLNN